jgi:prepilin-type N-terminal cleavage/methylation domain-containing protein
MSARRPLRRGFTLVELLVVIAILGVLMSMILFALQGASETARKDRTQAEITKINDLIMQRWDGYRQRPMPMRKSYPANTAVQTIAQEKLWATWELMRMELPERITDVQKPAVYLKAPDGATPLRPAMWTAYRRKVEALTGNTWPTDGSPIGGWSDEFSNAECLYLILSTIKDGDTNGLDFFTTREIGDLDADGVPEIHDGWGRPIRFLRWAPGFSATNSMPTSMQTGDATKQPDPFDPYKSYPTHFALFPLIYSAGPDGQTSGTSVIGYGINGGNVDYATITPPNDPWYTMTTGPVVGGSILENGKSTWIDNLTNHLNPTTR